MRPGHYTVRLTFANGGYLRFTYKTDDEVNQRAFVTGDGLMDGQTLDDGYISLNLGPRGIVYDPEAVVAVDMYPAKSDPTRSDEEHEQEQRYQRVINRHPVARR